MPILELTNLLPRRVLRLHRLLLPQKNQKKNTRRRSAVKDGVRTSHLLTSPGIVITVEVLI